MKNNPRAEAQRALLRAARDGKYINLELDTALSRSALTPADRALFAALVYGVCERALTLDYQIEHLTGRGADTLDPETLTSLRLGLYQIYFMDKIPPHAAVNETVAVSPARSRGLVNACLRRSIREGAELHLPDSTNTAEYLSVKHSIPVPIVESWLADYGDDAFGLCESANRKPSVTLRVNTLKTTPDELLSRLLETGVTAEINRVCPDMIDIGVGTAVPELYGYGDGLWFVQDAASRIAVLASGAAAGNTIVDVCSAPGGKSFSAALDMNGIGEIHAFDLHENKLGLIRRGASRLGIDIITAEARDGRAPDETLRGQADVTLCDVPCSGLGVIAKKPDIRYKDMDGISRLPEVQRAILAASASYVRPGGVLLYSTCTTRKAENDDVAADFLSRHPDFASEPFSVFGIDAMAGTLTLMPHRHATDGFYIAKFRRRTTE